MNNGYVKLYRRLLENPIFQKPNVLIVFLYCLLRANYTRKEILWNGKRMVIERGSFITGREKIARETGLSVQKVRTALAILELQGIIKKSTTKSTNKFSYRTVCNYDTYQDSNRSNNQQTNQQATSKQPQLRSNKKEKNNISLFESFWEAYPRKVEKKKALIIWTRKIQPESGTFEKIMAALKEQKDSKEWLKDSGAYIPHPTTWLNGERWNDQYEQSKPKYDEQGF